MNTPPSKHNTRTHQVWYIGNTYVYIIGMRNANADCLRFVVCEIECIFKTSSVSLCLVHMHQLGLQCICVGRARNTSNEWKIIEGAVGTVNSRLGTRNARDSRKMQIAKMQKLRTPSQLGSFLLLSKNASNFFCFCFVFCSEGKRNIQPSHYNCSP